MLGSGTNARPVLYGSVALPFLEVSGVAYDTVELAWSAGFELPEQALDWEYEYRSVADKFWQPTGNPNTGFAGSTGSTSTTYVLSGLQQSTVYEFRVRAVLKSGRVAPWSDPVLYETYPNIPLFDTTGAYPFKWFINSPTTNYHAASIEDGTQINTPDQGVIVLNRGQTLIGSAAQGDIVEASKPFNCYAIIGNEPYEALRPWCFGKQFVFNQVRANPQEVFVFAAQDANITLKKRIDDNPLNDVVYGSEFVSELGFTSFQWSDTRTHEITADGYIAVFAISRSPNYSSPYDQKPIFPATQEIIISPSTAAYISVFHDDSSIEWHNAEGDFAGRQVNSRTAYYGITRGSLDHSSNGRYHTCGGALVSSNKLIFGASVADSNGVAQVVGLPTNKLGRRCTLPSDSERIKVDSKYQTQVRMFYPGNISQTPDETHILKGVNGGRVFSFYWGNRSSPFDQWNGAGATFGVVPAGTYIEADDPIAVSAEYVSGATEYSLITV